LKGKGKTERVFIDTTIQATEQELLTELITSLPAVGKLLWYIFM